MMCEKTGEMNRRGPQAEVVGMDEIELYPFQRQIRDAVVGDGDGRATFVVMPKYYDGGNPVMAHFLWQMLHGGVARASGEEAGDDE